MENVNNVNLCPPPSTCPLVSVIIPLYNAEKYIGDCLDSLLAQTFTDFELIIVNDCSTDKSPAIVQSYREKFGGRLKLVHMEKNTGNGSLPRNKGLTFSRGEYIFNMDHDDLIAETALEEMYTLAKKFDADVVYCDRAYRMSDNGKDFKTVAYQSGSVVKEPTFETADFAQRVNDILRDRFRVVPWIKLVKRDLLLENEIFFPNTCHGDDTIWTWGLVIHAKKFLRVPNAVYFNRQSKGSIMRTGRTPLQFIEFWLDPVVGAQKILDKFMSRHEFFKRNPQYRYALLNHFVERAFGCMLRDCSAVPPFIFYETVKNTFRDRIGDEILLASVCTYLTVQQRNYKNVAEKFQKFAAQAQEQVKQFNQFAAQAKAYIARLEAEIRRLQAAQ